MKRLTELENFLHQAMVDLGDPSRTVVSIYIRLVPRPPATQPDDLIAVWEEGVLGLGLAPGALFPVDVAPGDYVVDKTTGQLETFGLEKICPGIWQLRPSLNLPGVLHAFVTLYDVPEPAPWENRIVVVSSLAAIGSLR